MENIYDIINFSGYKVTEEGQIVKVSSSGTTEKRKIMSTELRNGYCYIKLFDDEGVRHTMKADRLILCAKEGIDPLSSKAKQLTKEYRRPLGIMDQVKLSVNSFEAEEAVVQTIRSELIRQMSYLGIAEDSSCSLTADIVARSIMDYFRLWYKTRAIEETISETSREGNERVSENVLFAMKDRAYNNVLNGLKTLGLNFASVTKELPKKARTAIEDLFSTTDNYELI